MNVRKSVGWKTRIRNFFAGYAATYMWIADESRTSEEETWLGIG